MSWSPGPGIRTVRWQSLSTASPPSIINIDDLADLEDRAALAAHYAARLAGHNGIPLAELDAALDRMDAEDAR